jgi:hypothetical protein
MRLQFELTEEKVKELDELIDHLGLKTRVNLLNEALTLYEWAIHEREAGRIIASVDEESDKYKEVELPGFPPIEYKPEEPNIEILLGQLREHLHTAYQEAAFQDFIKSLNINVPIVSEATLLYPEVIQAAPFDAFQGLSARLNVLLYRQDEIAQEIRALVSQGMTDDNPPEKHKTITQEERAEE